MIKIKCLVADDEPLACDILSTYISELDYLELVGTCNSAVEVIHFLRNNKVDLLLLDIQMPRLSGIEMLRTLTNPPKVILVTAHPDYALQGYEFNIMDYLLKPVSFERFVIAINKYFNYREIELLPNMVVPTKLEITEERFIYVKADKKMVKIFLDDIRVIESLKDYVKIITNSQTIITYQKISYLEEKLPDDKFFRVHRSFIVAADKIESFDHTNINIQSLQIPIGRSYKPVVMSWLLASKI